MNDTKKKFIVVRGLPRAFSELTAAEEKAAELCERDQEDYTILVIDADYLDKSLVARYRGVVLHTIQEVRLEDDNRD
jgi:hypothetical protein